MVLDHFIKILYNSDIEEGDFVLIKYSKDSLKFLAKLDRKSVDRIRSAIAGLTQKLLIAWDPDFTKLTSQEEESLLAAEKSGFIEESEIDWDNLNAIV